MPSKKEHVNSKPTYANIQLTSVSTQKEIPRDAETRLRACEEKKAHQCEEEHAHQDREWILSRLQQYVAPRIAKYQAKAVQPLDSKKLKTVEDQMGTNVNQKKTLYDRPGFEGSKATRLFPESLQQAVAQMPPVRLHGFETCSILNNASIHPFVRVRNSCFLY
jgi:hypothetical protein